MPAGIPCLRDHGAPLAVGVGVQIEFDGGKIVSGGVILDLGRDGQGVFVGEEFRGDTVRRGRTTTLLPLDFVPAASRKTKRKQQGDQRGGFFHLLAAVDGEFHQFAVFPRAKNDLGGDDLPFFRYDGVAV